MFKNWQTLYYVGYNENTKLYEACIRIIDDNFIDEVVSGLCHKDMVNSGDNCIVICGAVIKCYTDRNLPVASNLFRFMKIGKETYPNWDYKYQISPCYKEYQPLFTEQLNKEINMYLTFV